MPNWCYNRVTVYGDSDTVDQVKEIYDIFENFCNFCYLFGIISENFYFVVAPIRHKGLLLCMYLL